jgi:hypothetical protein
MVYRIIKEIKDVLLAEPFVNTVTEGDIFEVDLNKQTMFPLSHIIINQATHQGNVLSFNITVLLMDVINQKDDSNKVDIWNTQLLLATRVLNRLNRADIASDFWELTGQPTYEPFTERFENDLAGWAVTFDVLVRNDITICGSDTVSVYSQVVSFDTPMNSIVYRCDGDFLAASYGNNENNLTDLIAMFNQVPPVNNNATFLEYGICYDNGDGRVRMEMNKEAYDLFACSGSLTLDVIYD